MPSQSTISRIFYNTNKCSARCILVKTNSTLQCNIMCWLVACVEDSSVVMDLISSLVEAGSLPSELLHQMLITDAGSTVKEQQVIHT